MRPARTMMFSVVVAGLTASTVGATAQTSRWTVRAQGGRSEAFVLSGSRDVPLVFSCRTGQPMWLDLHALGAHGWKANLPVAISIDGREFPMRISGHSDGVTLSNRSDGAIGIDRQLVGTLKGANVLVLTGPAAAAMPGAAKSFAVVGARDALGRLEKACGLPPAPVASKPSADPTPAVAAGAPGRASSGPGAGDTTDRVLTAAEVRHLVVDGSLVHTQDDGTRWRISFDGDGGFGSTDGRRSTFGSYEIGADGRVCISGRGPDYCMQYYRKAGVLRVRNVTSGVEIGRVTTEK